MSRHSTKSVATHFKILADRRTVIPVPLAVGTEALHFIVFTKLCALSRMLK